MWHSQYAAEKLAHRSYARAIQSPSQYACEPKKGVIDKTPQNYDVIDTTHDRRPLCQHVCTEDRKGDSKTTCFTNLDFKGKKEVTCEDYQTHQSILYTDRLKRAKASNKINKGTEAREELGAPVSPAPLCQETCTGKDKGSNKTTACIVNGKEVTCENYQSSLYLERLGRARASNEKAKEKLDEELGAQVSPTRGLGIIRVPTSQRRNNYKKTAREVLQKYSSNVGEKRNVPGA